MKGLLERAAYLCIVLKDYPRAVHYQSKLVSLCETMYLRNKSVALPHPLLAFHYYQLGKLQSQLGDFALAAETLHKAVLLISAFYGVKSKKDGEMINAKLVHEVNENYLANAQMASNKKKPAAP